MISSDYVESVATDSERIAEIGAASEHSRVPSCPDWKMRDLMVHVGYSHQFFTIVAQLPDGGRITREEARRHMTGPPAVDVAAWFRDGAADLVAALGEARPTNTVHTFYGTHHPLLLSRRAATETAIHRWDAEGVVGTPRPLDPALATDAVDEFLEVLIPLFFKYSAYEGTGQTICLEDPEADVRWFITSTAHTTVWRRGEQTKTADATARGSLSDLYLFCWGRAPAEPLEVVGDEELLRHWQSAAAF